MIRLYNNNNSIVNRLIVHSNISSKRINIIAHSYSHGSNKNKSFIRQPTALHKPYYNNNNLNNLFTMSYSTSSPSSTNHHSPASHHHRVSPLKPSNTLFFICDIQETFRGKIHNWDQLLKVSTCLTKVGKALDIQIIVTEQQPFKPTVSELDISGIVCRYMDCIIF